MILEILLVAIFASICIGDCYSTAKLLRHNHKLLNDKEYDKKVRAKIRKKLKADESNAEMSLPTGKLIRKYGGDRTMLYIGLFAYGPLSLFLLFLLLNGDNYDIIFTVGLIGFFAGILYRQIWKALTLKKRFGVDVWKDE